MPFRRLTLLLVALGLVVAGCAESTAEQEDATSPATGAPVSVDHDLGQVTLDRTPVRVVTTTDETTELVVALGVQPVGVGSTRVDAAAGDDARFADYYLPPEQLGRPAFVGSDPNLEAIAVLDPDLIVHGSDDEFTPKLTAIAPTLVYDVTAPGAWQEALTQLGRATGRPRQAADVVTSYDEQVATTRERLRPVAEAAPRVTLLYPQYRGGVDNFVFGTEYALASVLPELGFELTGLEQAAPFEPGLGTISAERYGQIPTDTILALGTTDWRQTSSAPVLSVLGVPVLGVRLDEGRPASGPLSAPYYLRAFADALQARPSLPRT